MVRPMATLTCRLCRQTQVFETLFWQCQVLQAYGSGLLQNLGGVRPCECSAPPYVSVWHHITCSKNGGVSDCFCWKWNARGVFQFCYFLVLFSQLRVVLKNQQKYFKNCLVLWKPKICSKILSIAKKRLAVKRPRLKWPVSPLFSRFPQLRMVLKNQQKYF
jgi:hypothetical protein